MLLLPYWLVLFLSLHAPPPPLPVPSWGRMGHIPLGWELAPSLRTPSPHLWPHPVWALLIIVPPAVCTPQWMVAVIVTLLMIGAPLLRSEHHAYMERLKETAAHGFVQPTFGIVHGWRTLLFSLYLQYIARPDVRDFAALRRDGARGGFLPASLPARRGGRPTVPSGLPQRQADQMAAECPELWHALVEARPGELARLTRAPRAFRSTFRGRPTVEVGLSPNEGAGAKGLLCLECDCARREVRSMQREIAHEHAADLTQRLQLAQEGNRRNADMAQQASPRPPMRTTLCPALGANPRACVRSC